MGMGGGLFPPPVGSLAKAGASGGWLAPPCLHALAFPSCHLCWELGEGLECHPWGEGPGSRWVGGTVLPIWALPTLHLQVVKTLFQGPLLWPSGRLCLPQHITAFLSLNKWEV